MKRVLPIILALGLFGCAGNSADDLAVQLEKATPTASSPVDESNIENLPKLAEAINKAAPVEDKYREIRACAFLVVFAFLAETKADYALTDPAQALGAIVKLRAKIVKARTGNPMWRNLHLSQALVAAGAIAINIGEDKLVDYVTRGLSVETFLFGAKNVATDAAVISYGVYDVKAMLDGLKAGTISEGAAWAACEDGLSEAIDGLQ